MSEREINGLLLNEEYSVVRYLSDVGGHRYYLHQSFERGPVQVWHSAPDTVYGQVAEGIETRTLVGTWFTMSDALMGARCDAQERTV